MKWTYSIVDVLGGGPVGLCFLIALPAQADVLAQQGDLIAATQQGYTATIGCQQQNIEQLTVATIGSSET